MQIITDMEEKYIVTVDLGSGSIRLSVARTSGSKIEVCYYNDYPAEGISHGKVLNISKLSAILAKAREDAERYLGIKINEVAVGCQKNDIRSISVHARLEMSGNSCVDKESLAMLEDLAGKEIDDKLENNEAILALVAQSYNIDDELQVSVEDIVGMSGELLEGDYKVFIGKVAPLKHLEEACRNAGISLHRHLFTPQYTGACVLSGSEKESGVALIDFGSGATSVSVYYGGVLRHYGAIPFGGDAITADIRNLCALDNVSLADNVKKGFGACMPDKLFELSDKTLRINDVDSGVKTEITCKYLSEVITARSREIIDSMLYEILQSGYADKLKNGIVVTGGGAGLRNLCAFIKSISGLSARIGMPSRNLFDCTQGRFFNSESSTSAALLLYMNSLDVNCAEPYAWEQENESVSAPAATKVEIENKAASVTETEPSAATNEQKSPQEPLLDTLFGEEEIGKSKKPGTKKRNKWTSWFSGDGKEGTKPAKAAATSTPIKPAEPEASQDDDEIIVRSEPAQKPQNTDAGNEKGAAKFVTHVDTFLDGLFGSSNDPNDEL